MTAQQPILYIDGENIRHYLKTILETEGIDTKIPGLENFRYAELFDHVLQGIKPAIKNYYAAKLHHHKEFSKKSLELIQKQRVLKSNLENSGFRFLASGNVRGQEILISGKKKVIFKEKGVDVKIAVDLVSDCCDKKTSIAILCSSDSDLQPAVAELKKRGIQILYVGFETRPNKGLSYTCDRTILLRNSEVVQFYKK